MGLGAKLRSMTTELNMKERMLSRFPHCRGSGARTSRCQVNFLTDTKESPFSGAEISCGLALMGFDMARWRARGVLLLAARVPFGLHSSPKAIHKISQGNSQNHFSVNGPKAQQPPKSQDSKPSHQVTWASRSDLVDMHRSPFP